MLGAGVERVELGAGLGETLDSSGELFMLCFGSWRKTLRIADSVLAKTRSLAHDIFGRTSGFVCDPKTTITSIYKIVTQAELVKCFWC